jgi:O-acetyl-ADP-ribose deacetylase (regulator of RNase III)
MQWSLQPTSLHNEPADALIVSANPFLNLSGGVGADLLNRYGQAIQDELHYYLRSRGKRHVEPCEVVPTFGGNTPYRLIVHAVAIDAFYDTEPAWVTAALNSALELIAQHDVRRVALVALATGYGHLSMRDFATGLRPLLSREYPPLADAVLCLPDAVKFDELTSMLPELARE